MGRWFVPSAYLLKIAASFFIYWLYTAYYQEDRDTTDIFKYYDDAAILISSLSEPSAFIQIITGITIDAEQIAPYLEKMDFWSKQYNYGVPNDNQTLIRLIAILYPFTFGHFHLVSIILCAFSTLGLLAIFKGFRVLCPENEKILALVIFLLPSVLLWSSSIMKEVIVLFGLGLFYYGFIKGIRIGWNKKLYASALIGFLILIQIKIYIILWMIPVSISFLIIEHTSIKKPIFIHSVVLLVFLISLVNLKHIQPDLDFIWVTHRKQHDFIEITNYIPRNDIERSRFNKPGSAFEIQKLDRSVTSFIVNTPSALFNSLLRPVPWNIKSPLMLASCLENIFQVFWILFCFYHRKALSRTEINFICYVSFSSLMVLLMIGWVVPVSGAIVRYKMPAILLLMASGLIMLDIHTLKTKFPLLNQFKILK